MTFFVRHRVTEKLESTLKKVQHLRDWQQPELTIEEAGLLYGFMRSSQAAERLTHNERALIEKAGEALERWQENRGEDTKQAAGARDRRTQNLLRDAITKLRMRRYCDLNPDEIELARGIQQAIRACKHSGPGSVRLAKYVKDGLRHYDRLLGGKPGQDPVLVVAALRRNSFILLLLAVFLILGTYGLLTVKEESVRAPSAAPPPSQVANLPEQPRRLSPKEKLELRIQEYEEKLINDPGSSEAPALRFALGNLHAQKRMDYTEAARHYELLLFDYPDWLNISQVYTQLEHCYEKTGEYAKQRLLYREMMERFPKKSKEHRYARFQLGY